MRLALARLVAWPLTVLLCCSTRYGCHSWNLPIYLLSWKVAPALAMGNTIVAKPSEITPRSASMLAQICKDVGLPDGVFNLVHGLGAGAGQAM
jgi:aminomuconate-semialdehyde/2-hydroxymuconate-6-semialdehyde dehydrogenase